MLASKILEAIIKPKDSLGITRDQMPQIDGKHIPEFLSWLRLEKGVGVETREMNVSDLKPSQGELDTDKADKIWDEKSAKEFPIIVSNDGFVLDGHHRWLAIKRNDESGKMRCHVIGKSAEEALELMHGFDKTTKRDINDKKVKEAFTLSDQMLESYKPVNIPFKKLKDHKVDLTKEERAAVKEKGAEWSDNHSAVFKSVIGGKSYYITHTHRAYNCCPTIAGACERFHSFIKGTA
jgi:hypothetical protein